MRTDQEIAQRVAATIRALERPLTFSELMDIADEGMPEDRRNNRKPIVQQLHEAFLKMGCSPEEAEHAATSNHIAWHWTHETIRELRLAREDFDA